MTQEQATAILDEWCRDNDKESNTAGTKFAPYNPYKNDDGECYNFAVWFAGKKHFAFMAYVEKSTKRVFFSDGPIRDSEELYKQHFGD